MSSNRFPFSSSLRAILWLLLASAVPLFAAREVRAIYLPGAGGALSKAYLVGSAGSVEVSLPQRNLSPEVNIPDGDLLFAVLPELPAEGQELPKGTPLVRIPAEWQRCMLIFLGDPTNKVFPARVIPINASVDDFPKGSTLVFNLSQTTLGGLFGEQRIVLKPGERKTFEPPIQDFGSYQVGIDCILKGEDQPRAICRSTWQHDPLARQILFVVPQHGQSVPRVWGVLDYAQGAASDTANATVRTP